MDTGVYGFKCIVNNKWYIGSAQNIANRLAMHIRALKGNRHSNISLQIDFNKYGIENFETIIFISNLPNDDKILIEKENGYIDFYKSKEFGYNNIKATRNRPSEETRKKHSESMKGKNSNITLEICIEIKNEILKYSENTKQKIIEQEIAEKFKIGTRTIGRIIRGEYRLSPEIGGSLKDWRKGNA